MPKRKHETIQLEDESGELHNYLLGPVIGKGCYSKIQLGEDLHTHKKAAIKISIPERKYRSDIINEINALQKRKRFLASGIKKIDRAHTEYYVAMEYYQGDDLSKFDVKNTPFEKRIKIAYAVLKELQDTFDAGILHRDIGPKNIFITGDHQAKLLDYQFAAFKNGLRPKKEEGMGTDDYIAPWIVAEKNNLYDESSDIWSTGKVLKNTLLAKPQMNAAEKKAFKPLEKMLNKMTANDKRKIPPLKDCIEVFEKKLKGHL